MLEADTGCVCSCCPQPGLQWMAVRPSVDLWTLAVL